MDVMICFFNFFDTVSPRYAITAKNFKHMTNIRDTLKDKVRMTFTLVGSEKEQSRELYLRYFNDDAGDTYIEFDQRNSVPCGYGIRPDQREFFNMLNRKIQLGTRHSVAKKPDISFWQGSNDFVGSDYFVQMAEGYKADVPQFYGVPKFAIGHTCACFYLFGETVGERLWWDGNQAFNGRTKYKCVPCISGINRCVYTKHSHILQRWSCDEGANEEETLKLPQAEFIGSSNIVVISPKISDKMDITTFTQIREQIKNNLIDIDALPTSMKDKIECEFRYFHTL
jgi:hypothetical protein